MDTGRSLQSALLDFLRETDGFPAPERSSITPSNEAEEDYKAYPLLTGRPSA